jgi:hypothetical protein
MYIGAYMANLTLSEIRQRCRERADMKESNFVEDQELTFYINQSIAELHDMLVQSYGADYYVKSIEFQTVGQQEAYDISSVVTDEDFYKLRAMDAQLNGDDWFTLQRFNFNERNRFQHSGVWDYLGLTNVRYRLVGDKIRFAPVPDRDITVRMWYVPRAATLAADTDTYNDFNGWIEYVIVDCAIKMLSKEESDVSVLLAEKQLLKRRVEEVANNRDIGEPESIQDIYVENDDYFYGKTRS